MRKLFYLLALFCTSLYYGQTNGITYQAVIYYPNGQNIPGQDIQNSPMTNKFVCLQFSLIDDLSQLEYQETIQTTTDEFGMVNLIIGSGTQVGGYAGSFNAVIWNSNLKTLKVELDPRGNCQDYIVLSDNPLSAVPFAYAALTANNVSGTVSILNGGTGANNLTDAKINLGLGNVDNTSDAAKPISTATQSALDAKEALSNKSTSTTLGTSDVLFPTQNAVKTYVDTQVASATIPDADASTKGKIQLAGDLSGTAAAPTVPALATKENSANKSAVTTLGTSDVLFPTQNAVKTYVDTNISTVNANNTALQATVTANANAATTAIAAVQADVDANEATSIATDTALQNNINTLQNTVATNATNTAAALALKEDATNKSTITTLGTSDVLFPTQNAVKTYVDAQVASATIPDADASTKGKIQLAGDLSGTAAAPTVPALATKENSANKSAVTTLGTSDVLFPTQNAVKTYVDTNISTVNANNTALQATVTANANAATTAIAAVQADVDANEATSIATDTALQNNINTLQNTVATNATNTAAALALKEDATNKSTITTLGTSDVLFPTQNAVKTYVDAQVASATIVDADANTKGKIQLAGDLSGTAAAPTVPALASKENTANKSAVTTLGTSDVLFPTQNAVKTYVDLNITSVNNANSALQATVTANANAATTAIAAVQADVDANEATSTAADTALQNNITTLQNTVATNATNTAAAIALKEDAANKSAVTTLGTSDQLFPTQNAVKTYVDTNISTVNANNTALQATVTSNANDATSAIAAVQADVDANETATNNALALKEDAANKSTTTTLGTSNQLFPTQNAVKTYVDTNISTVNANNTALQATVTANANDATSAIAAVQADVDANETATNNALALKEDVANKSTNIATDANSTTKYPSVKLIKDYVDTLNAAAGVADNTITSSKITDGTIMNIDVNANAAIDYSKLNLNNSIVTLDITDNAITSSKISDANVTNIKLATGIDATKLADGSVTNSELQYIGNLSSDVQIQINGINSDIATNTSDIAANTAAIATNTTNIAANTAAIATNTTDIATNATNIAANTAAIATNTTDIATNATNIAANTAAIATNTTDIATNTSDIAANTAAIATNTTDIATNATNIAANTAAIATNTTDIATNATNIAANTAAIATNTTDIATNTADIAANTAAIATNTTDIATNATNIAANTAAIATNTTDIATNTSDIAANTAAIATNTTDIATNTSDIAANTAAIATNTTDIATNATNIAANTAAIATNTTDIATNATNIAVNTAAIATNTSDIAANTSDIAANTAAIATNTTDIATNTSDIAANTAAIATNTTDIATNATNIAANTAAIATNTTDIATNATDIAANTAAIATNTTDIATNATDITALKTLANGKIYVGNSSNEATEVTPTGDVTITNAGVTAIGTGKVITGMLADDAVTTAKITDANVTSAKLADDAVETVKIKNANVTYAKIQNVSATDMVLGRVSSGAGVIEEIATTGSGDVVRATSPSLVTPNLGTPSAVVLTNATGLPLTSGAGVTGILPEANGGTGSATKNFVDLTSAQTVAGAKTFSGNTAVSGTSTFTVGTGATVLGGTLGVTGNTTIGGTTTLNGNTSVSGTNTLTVGTGATTLGGTLAVTGATTLSSTLNAGASTLSSATITNNATVGGTFGVTGATTLSSTLGVTGNTTIGGTTTLNGNTSVSGSNTLTVGTGATTLGGTLAVTGATTLSSTLGVTGDVAVNTDKFKITASSGNTEIAGTIKIAGGSPSAGKVLVSDANGLASWSSNSNGGASLISASATMAATDTYNLIVFSGSTAAQTITLPSASSAGAGREITIKNIASVSVRVNASGGSLISDSTTTGATELNIGIEPSNNWIKAISTGTNWIILRGLF